MRKRFVTTLSFTIFWSILTPILVAALIYLAIEMSRNPNDDTLVVLVIYAIIAPGSLLALFYNVQFAIIDEDGVEIRNCFKRIQYKNWHEIKNITCVQNVIPLKWGPNIGYYLLQDDRTIDNNTGLRKPLVSKLSYIKLPRKLKIRALIEEYYHGPFEEII